MTCSRIWCFCFGLTLLACTAAGNTGEDEYRQGVLLARSLIDRYGERRRPAEQAYLEYVRERLTRSLPASEPRRAQQIVLLNTDQVLAFAPGAGFILLSKGLVQSFGCEAELAFAVAHEMAHEYLQHARLIAENGGGGRHEEFELAADRFAIGLTAAAGYDPRMALYALNGAYRQVSALADSGAYPDLEERMAAIRAEIERARWMPPATVDRRDFQLLKRALIHG